MTRMVAGLCAAVVLMTGLVVASFAGPADAQDRTTERLDALEGTAEAQATQIADLIDRVAALESDEKGAPLAKDQARSETTRTLTGTFTIVNLLDARLDEPSRPVGTPCTGTGGYSDLGSGTSVVVKDESGTVIAASSLDPGEITDLVEVATRGRDCTFSFRVEDVPEREFYVIEVGGRGSLTYTDADLDAVDWHVELVIGD